MPSSTVSVIIPAYNEASSIGNVIDRAKRTLNEAGTRCEIIVVDDASDDDTAAVSKRAGAVIERHPYRMGNGAAIKSGIRKARGDLLVMLDADGQHPPEHIVAMLEKLNRFHMVVGSRSRESHASGARKLANGIYNLLASYVCGRKIDDLTSGFRAVRANIAREFLPLLPNTFSYPTTLTMALVRSGYSLAYLPIEGAQRSAGAKSKIHPIQDGTLFLMIIFRISTLYSPLKVFVPVSCTMFLAGFCYGLYKIVFLDGSYGPTSAMLMSLSAVVFLLGLVSEQIAQQRFEIALSLRHDRISDSGDSDTVIPERSREDRVRRP